MDLQTLWKTTLAEIELSISKPTYKTAFARSLLVSLENNVATIELNPGMRSLVEGRYYALIKSILDRHTKENVSLIFVSSQKGGALDLSSAGPLFNQTQAQPAVSASSVARRLHIRPESTFESFAVSTTNQMAYAAATAVAKSPGTAYNPLFLYGGVGVGKTHLMHAVANELLAARPGMRVVYCMGEEFLNEIIESIQTKTARQFKQKYRSAELLLVDDVQFIAGKQTAQEEFFHTFNAVHREGGQVILTSDRPPSEISRLEDRLRSRFEGGLTVDVASPDFELRIAIMNIKAGALGLTIPPDAAQLAAANLTDTRAIEGFLRRLTTEIATRGSAITPELVAMILKVKTVPPTATQTINEAGTGLNLATRVNPSEILDIVASHFDIKPTALKGPKRDRSIAKPRQIFMYVARMELGITLDDIGGVLGGRDHTTIMHGVKTITQELSTNIKLREDVDGVKQKVFHLSTKQR